MLRTLPSKQYKPQELERRIQNYWEEVDAYKKTKAQRASGTPFYFIDGPPYTSGAIHLGTAWNKIIKDTVVRYLRMTGHNVRDQPGYDMHGLPIEVGVERDLKIKNKKQIEEFGIDKFIAKCRAYAMKYHVTMTEQFKALGVWLDWERPYLTIRNHYIEAAWWTLKRAAERNLLIQAERVLTWCPRCETALAEAEVDYWDETDPSIYVKFPVKGRKDEYIIIWTTTPWTLPADLAVAVHPDFTYVRAKVIKDAKHEIFILLDARAQEVTELAGYKLLEIIEKIRGDELEGLSYVHPLLDEVPYQQQSHGYWLHKVVLADYVTAERTGCVHTAPGHGPDDFDTGKRYDLPPFCPVDESGTFTPDAGKYAGKFTKSADPEIIADLQRKGLMLHVDKVTHRYGHCWRCNTPITYRTTTQWFLKVTAIRTKMLTEISRAKWIPEWAGSSRFYDWVENTRDWCISRQRYWGIPLPIWLCKSCGAQKVIGSVAELNGAEGYTEGMDLHRPWIDRVKLTCDSCSSSMLRVPDVLDVWFDSAVCSWAQLNFPQSQTEFDRWWPCKWITEAHDQTRGWFYSQLGASVIAFDRIPYESVLMHGWALDAQGQPMSKSAGNIISPFEVTEKYGVDALRFYLLRASAPWEDIPFSWEGVRNAHRMLNILWNVYVFAITYMALDKFDPSRASFDAIKHAFKAEDTWLISRLESVKREVTDHLDKYNLHLACRTLEHFILEDLSRWYVRLVRNRTWIEADDPVKLSAYRTLYDALATIAILLAPITPHIAEELYSNLVRTHPTVHLCDWPKVNANRHNIELETQMNIIRELVELGAAARQKVKLKLRIPCKRVIIQTDVPEIKRAVTSLEPILLSQTNCKRAEVISTATVLPSTATPHLAVSEFKQGRVYIDTEPTPELRAEGYARELVRRIQQMRKEIDLAVDENIHTHVYVEKSELVTDLKQWRDYICTETRSVTIDVQLGTMPASTKSQQHYVKSWQVDEQTIIIGISKSQS